jgi:hypothetical protein
MVLVQLSLSSQERLLDCIFPCLHRHDVLGGAERHEMKIIPQRFSQDALLGFFFILSSRRETRASRDFLYVL